MSRPPHPPQLYNSNYTWRRVQYIYYIIRVFTFLDIWDLSLVAQPQKTPEHYLTLVHLADSASPTPYWLQGQFECNYIIVSDHTALMHSGTIYIKEV
jgi:hypothetical protein